MIGVKRDTGRDLPVMAAVNRVKNVAVIIRDGVTLAHARGLVDHDHGLVGEELLGQDHGQDRDRDTGRGRGIAREDPVATGAFRRRRLH